MQTTHEVFFEEFSEMANFCETYIQKSHQQQVQQIKQRQNNRSQNKNFRTNSFNNNMQFSHPQRRRKEPVDPDAPKKPLSSFILFYRDNMQDYQSKNPTLSMTEITKIIGKVWNSLSEGQQNEYREKAQKLKQVYEKDYAAYAERKGIIVPTKKKMSKKPLPKTELLIDDDDEKDEDDDLEIQEIDEVPMKNRINNNINEPEIIDSQEDDDFSEISDSDDDQQKQISHNDEDKKISQKNIQSDSDLDDDEENTNYQGNQLQQGKKNVLQESDEEEVQIKKKVKQQ